MDGPSGDGFRDRPVWVLALAVVVAGQVGLGRSAFGGWDALSDDRPVVAGRHPLHLYHGSLGAEMFRDGGRTSCYDPAFQAGYPKTPVFDGGSRPTEFVLAAFGTANPAATYKGMLLACCVFAPLAFALSARGAGVPAKGSCLAAAAGALLWWSPPVRAMFDAGDIDLLLAGTLGIVCIGGFARYHREPGPISWSVLAVVSVLGWYAHPVVWIAFTPVLVGYYLALAPRHGPAWHLGLAGVLLAGLAANFWWLSDWGRFWWLREQQALADGLRPPGPSAVFGSPADIAALLGPSALGWPVVLSGLVGCAVMTRLKRRTPGWLFAGTILIVVAVARLGQLWPPIQALGLDRGAPFAVGLAIVPSAFALTALVDRVRIGRWATTSAVLIPALFAWGPPDPARALDLRLDALPMGFTPGQVELIRAIEERTTPDARILIEDPPVNPVGWNWTALLPRLTARSFLGGLDGGACVDLAYSGLRGGRLNDRPLGELSNEELAEVCRLYNVGWVLARSPVTTARWKAWDRVREVGRYDDRGEVVLLAIDRTPSYVLAGAATLVQADRRQIVLSDVTANAEGEVLLSFHYQPGMRVTPATVTLEPANDPSDPAGFIRLRMVSGRGVARVHIRWDP